LFIGFTQFLFYRTIVGKNKSLACNYFFTIAVVNRKKIDLKWQHLLKANCVDRPTLFVKNLIPPADGLTFHFDFGDGTTAGETEVEHAYQNDGTYTIKFRAQEKNCSYEETVQLPMYTLLVPNVFTPDESPGLNDYFEVAFGKDKLSPADLGIHRLQQNKHSGKFCLERARRAANGNFHSSVVRQQPHALARRARAAKK